MKLPAKVDSAARDTRKIDNALDEAAMDLAVLNYFRREATQVRTDQLARAQRHTSLHNK